ncbi:MAG TPA: hypothetical protein HPP51_04020, partial [Planctomycetes bacterium]|nr:hypothetical protein [Planctomycetota bacterium]
AGLDRLRVIAIFRDIQPAREFVNRFEFCRFDRIAKHTQRGKYYVSAVVPLAMLEVALAAFNGLTTFGIVCQDDIPIGAAIQLDHDVIHLN